ncbi:glycosyltransferase family 2 protein [Egicoccus halophilus]|uniref:Glycosyl transferase family 2 n=1 Tax=Egicoccus halophilus TaxID=1670830 RepID=A0A8J3A7F1_9ACTN|nr:glycosyltransferase family A protein [Egicoccus halophilus]GGI05424.1 hypothetical protein GCM10011354_14030 [Egicoccus halophilus]
MSADVTVVIPTRDRLPLLAQTLHTVLGQRGVTLEVVVVDEGSTDGTAAWVQGRDDPRVRCLTADRPRGLPAARNAGLAEARAPWVAFVDDDDLWAPDKLARQLAAAERADAAWSYGAGLDIGPAGRLVRVNPVAAGEWRQLPWRNVVPGGGSNVVVRRDVLRELDGFDPSLPAAEDWDLWIRLARGGAPGLVADPVVAYRFHGGNMSRGVARMLQGVDVLDVRHRDLRDGAPLDREDLYRWVGNGALRAGDRAAARRLAWRARRAGHPGAGRRVARTLVPLPARVATEEPRSRLGRAWVRPSPPWPDGSDGWVRAALAVTP